MLDASPSFRHEFRTQAIPAVHEITDATLEAVRHAVSEASLLVSHRVRDDYNGLPVGTEQIAELAPGTCRRITVPALYYDGVYPFQVVVRDDAGRVTKVPLVETYHDVRFVWCASQGWDAARATAWIRDFAPPAEGLRALAAYAQELLADHERLDDVKVSRELLAPELHARSFFTVNHPTDATLTLVVAGIHERLGLPRPAATGFGDGLLGVYRTPIERSVIGALGLRAEPRPSWVVHGEEHPIERMLGLHLDWYRSRPRVVEAGVTQHERRMRLLGLPV
jgi:hypothetical protein